MSLINFDQALVIIADTAAPLTAGRIALADAGRRVLAEPVRASFDSPRTAVSTMDGYAVRNSDAYVGASLTVIGVSAAGARFAGSVAPGEAVRIFTGAALPDGADRVVIQELVTAVDDIIVIGDAGSDRFVRAGASDFAAGEVVVASGTRLTPGALVAAAGAGSDSLAVTRRPRVMTIATGDELCVAGQALGPDQIPDSIGPGLGAMIETLGGLWVGHALLADDLPALEAAAAQAVAIADLVVVIGGASVGARDHAKAMFAPLGMDLLFSKVAIKPGKPVWLGRVGATLVMGLPGNPGSALVTARLLLAPLMSGLLGQATPPPLQWIDLPLAAPIPATGMRETFLRAALVEGKLLPVANQDSGAQRALGEASWLIRCAAGQGPLTAATLVPALALQ